MILKAGLTLSLLPGSLQALNTAPCDQGPWLSLQPVFLLPFSAHILIQWHWPVCYSLNILASSCSGPFLLFFFLTSKCSSLTYPYGFSRESSPLTFPSQLELSSLFTYHWFQCLSLLVICYLCLFPQKNKRFMRWGTFVISLLHSWCLELCLGCSHNNS